MNTRQRAYALRDQIADAIEGEGLATVGRPVECYEIPASCPNTGEQHRCFIASLLWYTFGDQLLREGLHVMLNGADLRDDILSAKLDALFAPDTGRVV